MYRSQFGAEDLLNFYLFILRIVVMWVHLAVREEGLFISMSGFTQRRRQSCLSCCGSLCQMNSDEWRSLLGDFQSAGEICSIPSGLLTAVWHPPLLSLFFLSLSLLCVCTRVLAWKGTPSQGRGNRARWLLRELDRTFTVTARHFSLQSGWAYRASPYIYIYKYNTICVCVSVWICAIVGVYLFDVH